MKKITTMVIVGVLDLLLVGCTTVQITINPEENKQAESQSTELMNDKIANTQCIEDIQDEDATNEEYYLPGWVTGTSLETCVFYARVIHENNYNLVAVGCEVCNNSNENLYFTASNYFSINNNGIITYANPTSYDGTTLAPEEKFFEEILFECPGVTRCGDTLRMTMIVDSAQIHLGAQPQDEEDTYDFPGIYLNSSPSFDTIIIINDKGDGTYNAIEVTDVFQGDVRVFQDVLLDEENRFELGNGEYLWDSNNCCLYHYDSVEEMYVKDDPYEKQWFY